MSLEPTWTSAEAVRLTGATYRQVDWWHRCGWLGKDTAKGSGSHRRIDLEQLQRIAVLRSADLAGIHVRHVADRLDQISFIAERQTFQFVLRPGVTVVIRIRPLVMGVAA